MFAKSKPYSEMIELVRGLKSKYGLKLTDPPARNWFRSD